MPRGDGTGPNGMGPMTGRAAGYCAGFNRPGYANSGYGRGYGRGFGRGPGRGYGRGFGFRARRPLPPNAGYYPAYPAEDVYAPLTKEQEAEDLKMQAKELKAALEDTNKRLEELSKEE